jgi:hypothetical protein
MTVQNAELKQRQELAAKFIAKAWESDNFKQELISNSKAIFAKVLDSPVPDNVQIQVLEETSTTYYLVIPKKPEVVEALSDEALDALAGGARGVTTCGHTYTAEI